MVKEAMGDYSTGLQFDDMTIPRRMCKAHYHDIADCFAFTGVINGSGFALAGWASRLHLTRKTIRGICSVALL
jgi:hypothetical protein